MIDSIEAIALYARFYPSDVWKFMDESLQIEGIERAPTKEEITKTMVFFRRSRMTVPAVCALQALYTPDKPLRDKIGMNVTVGAYRPPPGHSHMATALKTVIAIANSDEHPHVTHRRFLDLHPFMDGNGRTGRALWAWQMLRSGRNPFDLPFLHRWYYQSLDHGRSSPERFGD